jgi:sugar lactone lactonase YvrE
MRTPILAAGAALVVALAACSDDPDSASAVALVSPEPVALASRHLAFGRVESVLPLIHQTDLPEGIALNRQGDIFVGNRRLEGDQRVSEILRITPDNSVSVLARLGPTAPDFDGGVLGLAVNGHGDLYAAFSSGDPATHGVWRIGRGGVMARLAGSEGMVIPNALAFDARGNLYVTDSQDGTVWRFPPSGPGALWLRHSLIAPGAFGIGANGIVFVPPATLFVANTDQGLIARVPIRGDGSPGEPDVAAAGFELLVVDGLAADVHGDLYAAIAGATIFGTAPVVKVDPRTGTITPGTDELARFDFPTSLAFGKGPRDHKSLYVVNAGLFPEDRPEAAPSVVRVGVGTPGAPIH